MAVYKPTYRDPIADVPPGRRRSPWNHQVTVEANGKAEEFYQGQSGKNANIVYGACIRTAQFFGETVTVRMAVLDGKREIGGWITKVERGDRSVDHELFGDPLRESRR